METPHNARAEDTQRERLTFSKGIIQKVPCRINRVYAVGLNKPIVKNITAKNTKLNFALFAATGLTAVNCDHYACGNGSTDNARNIGTHSVHQQEVTRIAFQPNFV